MVNWSKCYAIKFLGHIIFDTFFSLCFPEYFDCLSSLNQLKNIASQINWDLNSLVNHKYMAHQTALLFVSIGYVVYWYIYWYKVLLIYFNSYNVIMVFFKVVRLD